MSHIQRGPLLSPALIAVLVSAFGAMTSFYLLLSVVPVYVATTGSGNLGAGLSTGAMMLATVLTELAVPRLLASHGSRLVMVAGLVLLGVPALALVASPALTLVVAVCLARGAGLGIVVVTGTALVAQVVAVERRAEGLGLYGVVVGIPAVLGLPLGLWLSDRIGYAPVFVAATVLSMLALIAVLGLPSATGPTGPTGSHAGVLGGLRSGTLARPSLIFGAITVAAGVSVTFLPLGVPDRLGQLAAVALLVQSSVMPLARWAAGRFGDRHGSDRLLAPSVLTAAVGVAALVWIDQPVAVLTGMALFGAGFGAAQNVTLALMFERVPQSEFGRVSALWNIAYDAGMGAGAVGFGLLVGGVGYPFAFAVTAAVVFASLIPAGRDRGTPAATAKGEHEHAH